LQKLKIFAGVGYTLRREFDFFRADRRAVTDLAPYLKVGLEGKI
jgi:hypothetical protein